MMDLGFSQTGRNERQQLAERGKLLEVLKAENDVVSLAAQELYAIEGKNDDAAVEYCHKIIGSVDTILRAGDWETSLFLRNLIKPIKEIRDDAKDILQQLSTQPDSLEQVKEALAEHQQMLYVSLFHAKGEKLDSWETQLRGLENYLVGRPVYADEQSVIKVSRLKAKTTNEAYAIIVVDKDCVQKPNRFEVERKDRYGNKLETLRPGAVSADNIIEFVHNKKRYTFEGGHLQRIKEGENG